MPAPENAGAAVRDGQDIPARLAYNWSDGTPRVVSIWFHWDGSDIVMGTLPGAPKLKALSTQVDTNDPPYHVLFVRGAGGRHQHG